MWYALRGVVREEWYDMVDFASMVASERRTVGSAYIQSTLGLYFRSFGSS